ncbi:hypothetical protein C6P42_002295 [Pichia californica]|nr:hypothetical protein C6P42_002295 [[Candida] californica]
MSYTKDPFNDIQDDFHIGDDDDNYDNDDIIIQPDISSQQKSKKSSKLQDINLNNLSPTPINNLAQTSSVQPQFKKTFEGGYFSLNYYRQYFDINTSDFFKNCLSSMNPLNQPAADEFSNVGDLYGSVWITASLVFLLFFGNSFAGLLSGWFLGIDLETLKINYFKMIVSSINLLYGYTFIIPTILYLILKFYLKVLFLAPLTKLISIYSYANLLWSPAVFLSIFRGLLVNHTTLDTVLKWICIAIGALLSGCSIVYKIKVYFTTIFGEEDKKVMYILLLLLILAHIGFAIGVKVSFFGKL